MTWAELPMNQWVQLKIHLLLDSGWGLPTRKYVKADCFDLFHNGTLSLLWEVGRRWVSKQQSPRQDVGYPWWKSENTQLDDHHKISWYWKQVWSISSLIRASFPIQHKITRPPPRHHHQHHNCHHHHYHHHHHHPPHHHNRQHLTMIIRLGQSTWS